MKLQLALDRMSITQAIDLAKVAEPYVDWIEVGTSLIKMYGMDSIRLIREAFPEKTIVADMKTFDNAQFEFEMCFGAGADVATVMGAAPAKSIEICARTAETYQKRYMIDLLNTPAYKIEELCTLDTAILCLHLGKDQQEHQAGETVYDRIRIHGSMLSGAGPSVAVAGGIRPDTLPKLLPHRPDVIIVGEAITRAPDPAKAAKQLSDFIKSRRDDD